MAAWEGSLEENGHLCTYGWISLLSTWKHYNIVNWLYSEIKWKVKKKKEDQYLSRGRQGREKREGQWEWVSFLNTTTKRSYQPPARTCPRSLSEGRRVEGPGAADGHLTALSTPGSVPAAWPGDLRLCEQPASLMLTPQQYSLRQWEHFAPP